MKNIEIKNMSTVKRLQTMEELWDSLLYTESELKSPEWHQNILEERKKKIENGEAKFISIEKLKASQRS